MKYFQKTNIFRDETFSDKNFSGETISRKGDGHHRLWSWSGASTITITISGKPTYQRNISQVTHTGDEKIKADSENSNEAGLSGFACYPDCSKSDKSVNKIKKKSFSKQTGEIMALRISLICLQKWSIPWLQNKMCNGTGANLQCVQPPLLLVASRKRCGNVRPRGTSFPPQPDQHSF